MRNLILFGFKGSGKTYWGRKLAQAVEYDFVDTDRLVEELYAKQYGETRTCSEIYRTQGKEIFRQLEHLAVRSLQGKQKSIIALGGGAILDSNNLEMLKQIGTLIYLKVDKEVLRQRILFQPRPAFFELPDSFDRLYEERKPTYESIPCHAICLDNQSDQDILTQFREILDGK